MNIHSSFLFPFFKSPVCQQEDVPLHWDLFGCLAEGTHQPFVHCMLRRCLYIQALHVEFCYWCLPIIVFSCKIRSLFIVFLCQLSFFPAIRTAQAENVTNIVTTSGAPPIASSTVMPTTAATATHTQTVQTTSFAAVSVVTTHPPMFFPASMPSVVELVEGDSGVIYCEVKSALGLKLFKDGRSEAVATIGLHDNRQPDDHRLSWIISRADGDEHDGVYRCEGVDASGKSASHKVTVNVQRECYC